MLSADDLGLSCSLPWLASVPSSSSSSTSAFSHWGLTDWLGAKYDAGPAQWKVDHE